MWATIVSFPLHAPSFPKALTYANKRHSFSLRASLSDYPLASRIMVRNLPYSTSESNLRDEFSNFGQVAEVNLVKDEITKNSKGYAFIQYTSQDAAMLALENMDQKKFNGRMVYIELAKPGSKGYLKTVGPPTKRPVEEQVEVADCWY